MTKSRLTQRIQPQLHPSMDPTIRFPFENHYPQFLYLWCTSQSQIIMYMCFPQSWEWSRLRNVFINGSSISSSPMYGKFSQCWGWSIPRGVFISPSTMNYYTWCVPTNITWNQWMVKSWAWDAHQGHMDPNIFPLRHRDHQYLY